MNRTLGAALLALLCAGLGWPRQARADEYVETDKLYGAPLLWALDLGLGTADVVFAARAQQPSRVYAGAEILLTAPQVVIFARFYQSTNPALGGTRLTWAAAMVWAGALSLHGLVDLVRPAGWPQRAPAEVVPEPRGIASGWSLAPTAVDAGPRAVRPGIALLGFY